MKHTLIACVAWVMPCSPLIGVDRPQPFTGDLAQDFKHPPHEAKPWVYWWFEGGYANPEGMAKDIAAMKDKGIGGVMHMQTSNQGGRPVPSEPKMLGPEWDAWFGEALRLAKAADLTMAASIVDGWGHGGGWVGNEDGAKQLVYSEIQVNAPGLLDVPLPVPLTRLGVYRDVAVVAFQEKTAKPPVPQDVKTNNVKNDDTGDNWQALHAVDGDPETCWGTQEPCKPQVPALLDLTFAKPLTVTSALVAGMPQAGPKEAEILTSDDGKTFKAITRFTMAPGEQKRVEFPAITARFFRLSIPAAHTPDLQLAEFQLLRQGEMPALRRGIKHWAFKSSNFSFFGWPPKPYTALEEEHPEDGACDVSAASVADLSKHLQPNGVLDWKFPAGQWTVLRFGWTPLAEPARMGNGGGYEADVLSTKCADLMMDIPAKRMRELSVKHAGGAPIFFHTDSWEIGLGAKGQQPTWTDDFRKQFQTRRGYDLVTWLPAMARRIVDDRQTTDRFLWDYRTTVADLLADYYGRLQERAHQMNGGIASESGYGTYPIPHMDGLKVFGRCDRPMAEFWHGGLTWAAQLRQHVDVMRTAASAARIYGYRFVQAETLTFDPTQGLFERPLKYRKTLHEAWARGLNQAVIHKYTHQPTDEKPGMIDYDIFNRNFSWWPLADGFISYMGRCQYLLQQGDFAADAAYFVGDGSFRFVPAKEFLNPALPSGYDYDGINAEVLFSRAAVRDGRLVLPPCKASSGTVGGSGPSYRYLVLTDPQCVTMTAATLGRIRQLVEAGLTLVGKRPLRTPGLADLKQAEAVFKGHADALWGADGGDTGDRVLGKGRVVWGRPVGDILTKDGLAPDCEASEAGKPYALSWLHRRVDSDQIYFLANPQDQPADLAVTVRAKGKVVRLFDPLDGSIRDLPETGMGADGRTTVPLHFEGLQALFLVLGDGTPTASPGVSFPDLKPLMTVEGPWTVTFDAAWVKPLPPSVAPGSKDVSLVMAQLADWNQRPEDGIKGYSGVATYRKLFSLPAGIRPDQPMVLDLGVVMEMARVEINGKDLGVAWSPPWRVAVPPGLLKVSDNQLVITVANTWNNRLSADAKLPNNERVAQCRASGNGPQPAGLLGPVVLRTGVPVTTKATVRSGASRSTAVTDLRCEYRDNPLGIDTPKPRLSWVIEERDQRSEVRGQRQSAYQVLVASTTELLAKDRGDLWDSGRVASDQSIQVEYAGKPLESRMVCHWKVRVWLNDGTASDWSTPAGWSMGLLKPEDWQAKWVKAGGETSPWLRKEFTLAAVPERAMAFVNVKGYYELYVNGKKVSDDVLAPAVSVYDKRSLYTTYDISKLLRPGSNCVGVWLGLGLLFPKEIAPLARVQLDMTAGGQRVVVGTDTSWTSTSSTHTEIAWGWCGTGYEKIDARLEIAGWNEVGCTNAPVLSGRSFGWRPVEEYTGPTGIATAQSCLPNRITKVIPAVACIALDDHTAEFDFGTNLSGWFRLRLPQLEAGKTVTMHFADKRFQSHDGDDTPAGKVKPALEPKMIETAKGPAYYQTNNQRTEFISAGKAGEEFCNKFNYEGFRYVIVQGLPVKPALGDAEALFIESDFQPAGTFECSNTLFNRIHQVNLWTIRCLNLGGYMVDCPHRERMGYGDGQNGIDSHVMNLDSAAFYGKWAIDWLDAQDPVTGKSAQYSPPNHGDPSCWFLWGGMVDVMPWKAYTYYGDRRLLERAYEAMVRYPAKYIDSFYPGGGIQRTGGDSGCDWVAPNIGMTAPPGTELFVNCYRVYLSDLLAKSADVIGRTDEAKRHRARSQELKALINAAYYNKNEKLYDSDRQLSQAMPLLMGVVPDALRETILKQLEDIVMVKNKGHLDTGMLGTYFLIQSLQDAGRDDLLYTIFNQQDFPGWGYMLSQGATTFWEQWNGSWSQIHSCYVSPGSWFYQGLAGIRPDETGPGFKKIIIKPAVVGDLTWVKCGYDSIHGRITSDWQRDGAKLTMDVIIPPNTTATVYVPSQDAAGVTESGKPAAKADGVKLLRMENAAAVYEVGSGSYRFQSTVPAKQSTSMISPDHFLPSLSTRGNMR